MATSFMAEEELARLCRQGDETARKVLYECYAQQMLGVCLRYAGNRALAEDWLHDAFLKIYCSMDKFTYQGEGSLRAWMMAVLHNGIVESLRRQNVLDEAELMDEGMDMADDEADEDLAYDVDDQKLLAMVAQLPVGQRTVFNMFVFDGMSHKEIARQLGIKEKSSSSQLFRARQALALKVRASQRKRRLLWSGVLGLTLVGLLTHYIYNRGEEEKPVAKVEKKRNVVPRGVEEREETSRVAERLTSTTTLSHSVPLSAVEVVPTVSAVPDTLLAAVDSVADTLPDVTDSVPRLTPEDYWAMLQERLEESAESESVPTERREWSVNFDLSLNGRLLSTVDESAPVGEMVDMPTGPTQPQPPDNPVYSDPDSSSTPSEDDEYSTSSDGGSSDGNSSAAALRMARRTPATPQPHRVADSKNHYSWSAGLRFRRPIGSGFSFETGLSYTLLTSDIRFMGTTDWQHQQMHYVGVPLRLSYDLLHNRWWTSYVSAGGEVERCLFGKQGSYRHTPTAWQWSVDASAGFQYNATPHVGFYLEPNIHYYFDDGTDIPTRRKEAPLMLNLRVGVRLTH